MKLASAEFVKSCLGAADAPRDRLPEVAFVGRSNVGKSSLINSLLHRKGLAKVSRTPGKTRMINYFRVVPGERGERPFYLVDLPGYGYAKAAKSLKAQWDRALDAYLTTSASLRGVVLLLDSRGIEAHDVEAYRWLADRVPHVAVVATKTDKLTRSELPVGLDAIRATLALPADAAPIAYSSVTGQGRLELWHVLRAFVAEGRQGATVKT